MIPGCKPITAPVAGGDTATSVKMPVDAAAAPRSGAGYRAPPPHAASKPKS